MLNPREKKKHASFLVGGVYSKPKGKNIFLFLFLVGGVYAKPKGKTCFFLCCLGGGGGRGAMLNPRGKHLLLRYLLVYFFLGGSNLCGGNTAGTKKHFFGVGSRWIKILVELLLGFWGERTADEKSGETHVDLPCVVTSCLGEGAILVDQKGKHFFIVSFFGGGGGGGGIPISIRTPVLNPQGRKTCCCFCFLGEVPNFQHSDHFWGIPNCGTPFCVGSPIRVCISGDPPFDWNLKGNQQDTHPLKSTRPAS